MINDVSIISYLDALQDRVHDLGGRGRPARVFRVKRKETMMKEKDIGALWIKEGKNGKYFSGVVEIGGEKTRIVVFKNSFKTDEKHPDYRVYRARSQQQETTDDIPF